MRSARPRAAVVGRYPRGHANTRPMRLRRYLSILTMTLILGVAGQARAESSTQPSYGPTGIRLGDRFVLHLSMGLEFDWDSNVFFAESGNTINAFFMRLTPQFQIT